MQLQQFSSAAAEQLEARGTRRLNASVDQARHGGAGCLKRYGKLPWEGLDEDAGGAGSCIPPALDAAIGLSEDSTETRTQRHGGIVDAQGNGGKSAVLVDENGGGAGSGAVLCDAPL